jgi:asparagine synthase (glutamine-hydrolysing)
VCGIAGILSHSQTDVKAVAVKMAQVLSHRGPDAGGAWSDESAGIALSHRRLSIIDLSSTGAQPMTSHQGRYVLSYNGEIYNFQKIRADLEKETTVKWRGHSDTEVLLAAIETWGLVPTLKQVNGMFAFALWDKKERQLALARDRLGEKPLYVGWLPKTIVFASELKALQQLSQWRKTIDRQALGYLLRFGYIPVPLSIYAKTFKLPQAHYMVLSNEDIDNVYSMDTFSARCQCYWDLTSVVSNALEKPFWQDQSAALDQLEALLTESIRLRMVADVPVGSMLSGGIDSSLVTAIMQRLSPKPVKTFTIGFTEDQFDEAKYAKPVARHLGTDHTEIILAHKDAMDVIPKLPNIYDEPFADPSQIPTVLVSEVARIKVTVALSGDGGDELFGGYGRYWAGLRVWPYLKRLPPLLRQSMGRILSKEGAAVTQVVAANNHYQLAHRIWRFGRRIMAKDFDSFYTNLLSLALIQVSASHWPTGFACKQPWRDAPVPMDLEQRMMLTDQQTYLPDDVLVKTDRASMAVGLELRVPLLDPNIIEFAWKLPPNLRRKGKSGKLLLHRLLYRYVPSKLVDRPKKGFEIPQDEWLRGPLKEWMLDLLAPSSILKSGYLDNARIQQLIKEHLGGQGEHGYALWPALMFQAWLSK